MQARLLGWSLRHRRGRHLLNLLAMAVTVAVVMAFVAVMFQLLQFSRRDISGGLVRVLVAPRIAPPGSGTDGMPLALGATLAKLDGVKVVQRKLVYGGAHESGAQYTFFGEDPSGIELNTDIYPVDAAMIEAWKKEPTGAIVTDAIAKALRLEVGKQVEVPTDVGPIKFKVVGITKGAVFDDTIGVHFEYLQQVSNNRETCGYRVFTTRADMDRVISGIVHVTKNSSMPAQGISLARMREDFASRAATIPAVLGFLGLFLVFTTTLTLANNSAISIRERRVEVATLRVIGYQRGTIVRLLIGEAVVVGFAGGLLAVAVVSVAFHGGVALAPPELLGPAVFGIASIVAGLVVAVIVPLLGAVPAAFAAVRVPIVEGLRDS